MRSHVVFNHPAEFVPLSDDEGILGVQGAGWFRKLLLQIPGAEVEEPFQEDWGVAIGLKRNGMRFWVGLSPLFDDGNHWIAHLHHDALLQRFRQAGHDELLTLAEALHQVLASDPLVSNITWHRENELKRGGKYDVSSRGAPSPLAPY